MYIYLKKFDNLYEMLIYKSESDIMKMFKNIKRYNQIYTLFNVIIILQKYLQVN